MRLTAELSPEKHAPDGCSFLYMLGSNLMFPGRKLDLQKTAEPARTRVAKATRIGWILGETGVEECELGRESCSSFIAAAKGKTVRSRRLRLVVVGKKGAKRRWKEWARGDKLFYCKNKGNE